MSFALTLKLVAVFQFACLGNAADTREPESVWPLLNTTREYDVTLNQKTASFCSSVFNDQGLLLTEAPSCEGGRSYVDIELTLKFDDKFSVAFNLTFSTAVSGHIFTFINSHGFDLSAFVYEGQVNLKVAGSFITCGDPADHQYEALSEGLQQIVLEYSGDYFKFLREGKELCKVKIPELYRQAMVGILRLGASGESSSSKGIEGHVACVRLYPKEIEFGQDFYRHDCTDSKNVQYIDSSHRLEFSSAWTYEGPYACMRLPCKHGGTCEDIAPLSENNYSCLCAPGYTGHNCETDIDDCISSPCENEGTCSDKVNGFTCQCTPHFYGNKCETATERKRNAGSLYMMEAGVMPDEADALFSQIKATDIECGLLCDRVKECLSFAAVEVSDGDRRKCILHSTTEKATTLSRSTKYYRLT